MAKTILIFSDGTGQLGGLRPDQCLSNVYKMYRATRPGPDSPIDPATQVAFYDPGLGTSELGGWSFKRTRKILAAGLGLGIDENLVDCYAATIANYEPGDRLCFVGFSRGAYTVRALANVLNLCGIPTRGSDGGPVPTYGPALRKIATDAVRYIYNHGAGSKRDAYETEREAKATRFRKKYGSEGIGVEGEPQGNVQPTFVGVFDTVAALGSRSATFLALGGLVFLVGSSIASWRFGFWWGITAGLTTLSVLALYWMGRLLTGQYKYFLQDENRRLHFANPLDWPALVRHGHLAWWSGKHYDRYVDKEVRFLRHARSIDEARRKFPLVGWGRQVDVNWNEARGNSDWMLQVWFAGNHSDIGGSYPEEESRLSDVSLKWMVGELEKAVPSIQIRGDVLRVWPDPLGIQHDEIEGMLNRQPSWLRALTRERFTWRRISREVPERAMLHDSVVRRLEAATASHMGRLKVYRPTNLVGHETAKTFYATSLPAV